MNLAQYAAETGITPTEFHRKLHNEYAVDVGPEAVRRWIRGTLQPSHKWMWAIEAATAGRVTRYHQRPDIFGEAPKQEAAE